MPDERCINKILKGIKAYNGFGSDMGRLAVRKNPTGLLLRKVRLDAGGYDAGGAYWGGPDDMYCAYRPDLEFMVFVRASSRSLAKKVIAERYSSLANKLEFVR